MVGWVTSQDVLRTVARRLGQNFKETEVAAQAAEWAVPDVDRAVKKPWNPLRGYRMVRLQVRDGSRLDGRLIKEVVWPGVFLRWSRFGAEPAPSWPTVTRCCKPQTT